MWLTPSVLSVTVRHHCKVNVHLGERFPQLLRESLQAQDERSLDSSRFIQTVSTCFAVDFLLIVDCPSGHSSETHQTREATRASHQRRFEAMFEHSRALVWLFFSWLSRRLSAKQFYEKRAAAGVASYSSSSGSSARD
jgi:hypothetical protein